MSNRSRMSDFSSQDRDAISAESERVGVGVVRVLANADALFSGRSAIYRDPIFGGWKAPARFRTFLSRGAIYHADRKAVMA